MTSLGIARQVIPVIMLLLGVYALVQWDSGYRFKVVFRLIIICATLGLIITLIDVYTT